MVGQRPLVIALVKPHPPQEILRRACPTPEPYRYDWEPMALRGLAHALTSRFGAEVRVKVWHLMDEVDDRAFAASLAASQPDVVGFSELDVLVPEVNRWCRKIKARAPSTVLVVGGKQSSLLRAGDPCPFPQADRVIRGDGVAPLLLLVERLLRGEPLGPALDLESPRAAPSPLHFGRAARSFPIERHDACEYFTVRQRMPTLVDAEVVPTASVLTGMGCPHACTFCQSPLDFGIEGRRTFARDPDDVADEVLELVERSAIAHVFAVEPNLDLEGLSVVYDALALRGVSRLSLSGFVRAADVQRAHRRGRLAGLARRGLRNLSIGLDIPLDTRVDRYRKGYSCSDMLDCLAVCERLGILVHATVVGDPTVSRADFAAGLDRMLSLPVASLDVRLAIALRNTAYFREMEPYLLLHPDRDETFWERQNYRYQTMAVPGGIEPEETYALVRDFHGRFLGTKAHTDWVLGVCQEHPDTRPFFRRQYQEVRAHQGRGAVPSCLGALLEG